MFVPCLRGEVVHRLSGDLHKPSTQLGRLHSCAAVHSKCAHGGSSCAHTRKWSPLASVKAQAIDAPWRSKHKLSMLGPLWTWPLRHRAIEALGKLSMLGGPSKLISIDVRPMSACREVVHGLASNLQAFQLGRLAQYSKCSIAQRAAFNR